MFEKKNKDNTHYMASKKKTELEMSGMRNGSSVVGFRSSIVDCL